MTPPGPYERPSARPTRLRRYTEAAPTCTCGCGQHVTWDYDRERWRPYATTACYRPPAPYKDREWLVAEYVDKRRTIAELAQDCGVSVGAIRKQMKRHGVVARDRSEARAGRRLGADNHAWKGGVADWAYSPDWKRIARAIRKRDRWTCQACGERRARWGKLLHVHHIDGDKDNNDPRNLISVCASCHPRGSGATESAFAEGVMPTP